MARISMGLLCIKDGSLAGEMMEIAARYVVGDFVR
jgi:hypothetical protein